MTLSTTSSALEASQAPPGVSPAKATSGARSRRIESPSWRPSARAKATPSGAAGSSVAEGDGTIVDPFPQRHRPAQAGVGDELRLLELTGVEADGADEELAAGGFVALHEVGK